MTSSPTHYQRIRRLLGWYRHAGVAVGAALAASMLIAGQASADLLQSRSIQLSSSQNGSSGGTNVIYKVSLTVSNAATNIGGVVIDFCSNTPVVADPCTAPTGFNTNKATLSVNNQTNISGLSVDTTNSTSNKLILTKTAGAPASAAVSFELGNGTSNGLTNPTSNGTYYARIYTYATSAAAQGHTATSPSGYTDEGGVAMSTANQVSFTFDVAESLSFCVYTNANCGAGGTSVNLGDTNGFLRTSGPFVDKKTKFDVATNAAGSPAVTINFKGQLLTSGSYTIASIGNTGTSSAAGTSQFGICGYRVSGTQLSISAPYNNSAADGGICSGTSQTAGTGSTGGTNSALFAFRTANVTGTYGDTIATVTGPTATATGDVVMIGNIGASQQAGTYTTSFTFIATGNY